MGEHGIHKLSIKETSGFEISLETIQALSLPDPVLEQGSSSVRVKTNAAVTIKAEETSSEKMTAVDECLILSPMVGVFYASPSPNDSVFVQVGDHVNEDTVVCIIEAMKVMNEVKAGKSGIIKEVYLDNYNPVEFGSKLFLIE